MSVNWSGNPVIKTPIFFAVHDTTKVRKTRLHCDHRRAFNPRISDGKFKDLRLFGVFLPRHCVSVNSLDIRSEVARRLHSCRKLYYLKAFRCRHCVQVSSCLRTTSALVTHSTGFIFEVARHIYVTWIALYLLQRKAHSERRCPTRTGCKMKLAPNMRALKRQGLAADCTRQRGNGVAVVVEGQERARCEWLGVRPYPLIIDG